MYNQNMIKTFRNKETELIYRQQYSKALPQQIQHIALRKLMMIDSAQDLNDLRVPLPITLNSCTVTAKDSTAYGSMTDTGSVLRKRTAIFTV